MADRLNFEDDIFPPGSRVRHGGRPDEMVVSHLLGGHDTGELRDERVLALSVSDAESWATWRPNFDAVQMGAIIEVEGSPDPVGAPPVARSPGVVALTGRADRPHARRR
jgi:hypothetical protein